MVEVLRLESGDLGSSVAQHLITSVIWGSFLGLLGPLLSSLKRDLETLSLFMYKKLNLDLKLTPCTKISLKWIKVLNVSNKTVKSKLGKDFFDILLKAL